VAGVGHEHNTRAAQFELLDEVLNSLPRMRCCDPAAVGWKSGSRKTFSMPSGSEPFTRSGSWVPWPAIESTIKSLGRVRTTRRSISRRIEARSAWASINDVTSVVPIRRSERSMSRASATAPLSGR